MRQRLPNGGVAPEGGRVSHRETLGEALERVRQDIERLPWLPRLIMRRRWRKAVELVERFRIEGIADNFAIYIYACPPSCECEGGDG